MSKNQHSRHAVVALVSSIIFHFVLLVMASQVDFKKERLSTGGKILDVLGKPGWVLGQWLLPGHDLMPLLVDIVCSIVFYAIAIWAALAIWSWSSNDVGQSPIRS
jgi:hypothetical protein